MQPLSFHIDYRLDDWRAYNEIARHRVVVNNTLWERLRDRWPGILLILLIVAGCIWFPDRESRITWAFGIVTALVLFTIQTILIRRRMQPRPDGAFLEPARVDIDASGMRFVRATAESFVRWSRVMELSVTPTHIVAWVDALSGHVLPLRALPKEWTADAVAAQLREFMAGAATASNGGAATPGTAAPLPHAEIPADLPVQTEFQASAAPTAAPGVWREIGSLGRLLLMMRPNGANLVGRDLTIFVVTVILLAIWMPLDRIVFGGDMEFSPYALPSLAWVAVGVLGLAWILKRLTIPSQPYRRTLLLSLGVLPIAIVGSTVSAFTEGPETIGLIALITLWVVTYFSQGMRALTGTVQARAILAAAVAGLGFLVVSDQLYVNPSPWYFADDDAGDEWSPEGDAQTWTRMEELQFGQQQRLDEELARIAALPREKNAVYFVGFAGYGEQRVFAEEIGLARRQVAARYGSADRSVSLVNDRRAPDKLPLASAPALRYTLESIGSMMDPDDVLFLALSSHGSQGGSISVSNAGRQPAELSAVELAGMLRDAKIPWKVVVVSACYAGGFIDALRDEHTIVLAAAAADRTSFGCSDDRDLTYFGEAFYRDALPKAVSLRAAFEVARAEITRREKEEKVEPSDPQAFYGELLEAKLK